MPAGGSGTMFDAPAAANCGFCAASACAAAFCACAPPPRPARADAGARARPEIEARHRAVLRLGIHDRPVGRILLSVEAVAAADAEPVGVQDADVRALPARPAPRPVVLQAAAHVVRLPHVGADRVELADGHRRDEVPRVTAVVADVEAAVVPVHHVAGVLRIDPDGVMVAVREVLDLAERPAAVDRLEGRRAAHVDHLVVVGVDAHLAVIHRPVGRVAHDLPRLARIVRPPDARALGIGRTRRLPSLPAATADTGCRRGTATPRRPPGRPGQPHQHARRPGQPPRLPRRPARAPAAGTAASPSPPGAPPPPRPCPGACSLPSAVTPAPVPPLAPTSNCATMTFGLVRQISRPMRPMMGLSGRPLPVSFVQVLPPSVVFHNALPGPPPLKPCGVRRRW